MPTPEVVRIVVRGWTYVRRRSDNFTQARAMLSDALASTAWPSARTAFTVTPGGFIRAILPGDYRGARGWDSKKRDLGKLIPHADAAVDGVVRGDILENARRRTRFLTLGVDLNVERHKEDRIRGDHCCRRSCPWACTHAELVAVLDTDSGKVVRLTGKSYPVEDQQHTLVHVEDLRSHFLEIGSEVLLVLGCHDLHLFSGRGKPSESGITPKEERSRRMTQLARKFKPTIVLHHPHTAYSPYVWASAWGGTRSTMPKARLWASGIAFCGNPKHRSRWKPWQTLDATLAATASQDGVIDVVIAGRAQAPSR